MLVHEAQDHGIEAVWPGARRDHYDQHESVERLRQIQKIVDAIRSAGRLVQFDPLPPGRGVENLSMAAGRVNAPTATANATGSSMKIATATAGTGVGMPSRTIWSIVPE